MGPTIFRFKFFLFNCLSHSIFFPIHFFFYPFFFPFSLLSFFLTTFFYPFLFLSIFLCIFCPFHFSNYFFLSIIPNHSSNHFLQLPSLLHIADKVFYRSRAGNHHLVQITKFIFKRHKIYTTPTYNANPPSKPLFPIFPLIPFIFSLIISSPSLILLTLVCTIAN